MSMTFVAAARRAAAMVAALLTALVVVGVAAPSAQAHTALKESSPAKDATVPSPSEIALTYTDEVMLPQVVLTDPRGQRRQGPKPTVTGTKVTLPIEGSLEPGTYTVAWRVVSADGHPVTGTYEFTVEGTASTPAPASSEQQAPPVTETATPTAANDGGSGGWLWVGLGALAVAALAGGGALLLVRRRPGPGRP
ncbi:copper resistance CopC family protein [Thermomonospora umbrina]|uniref:CopC domain-containing protein n=1 Tax=Thermomonospora umbrina TaxID=111806 RepID=A0A3D9SP55_9ACTN|nr:copper resistance protein CopC [Thermomonospora umbrina]REE94725.1 hypothetical protein DFJ69_0073 [Thermomonospora umbrina]